MAKSYLDKNGLSHFWGKIKSILGVPEAPYTEVEWVESCGKQGVYLDWKPPVNTWGFSADFIIRNAFSTTAGTWAAAKNANGYGNIFGTRNSSGVNDLQLGSYGSTGTLRIGNGTGIATGMKTDKSRQQISLIGTKVTKADGSTATVTRQSETSGKPYANMCVFCMHEGLRRSGTGNLTQPGTVRIYSLKFYEGSTVKVDLVGAIRKSDGVPGLYDKIANHFYPSFGLTYGNAVGDLGSKDTILRSAEKKAFKLHIDNGPTNTRMWRGKLTDVADLEDGQVIDTTFTYAVGNSVQTTELAGWDDTTSNSQVYLKLTLANNKVTEWIPVYYSNTSRLTTQYGSTIPLRLTYRENLIYQATETSVESSIMRGFFCDPSVNTNTVYGYGGSIIAGPAKLFSGALAMQIDDTHWESVVLSSSTGTSKSKNANGFLLTSPILYNSQNVNAGAASTYSYQMVVINYFDVRYSFNVSSSWSNAGRPVFLVGTISGNYFFLKDSQWWADAFPTTNDGYYYWYVGQMIGKYQATLYPEHPIYYYDNGLKVYDRYKIGGSGGGGTAYVGEFPIGVTDNTISHAESGVVDGSYGPSADQTPGFGSTFPVPYVTVDAKGHVTEATSHTVKIPSTAATTSADGLMSSADKTKMNAIGDVAGAVNGATSIANKSVPGDSNVTNLGSFTLPAGLWIVRVHVRWNSNADGNRTINISLTSGGDALSVWNTMKVPASPTSYTHLSLVTFLEQDTSKTYYLNAQQNSGKAITAAVRWGAIRIA